MSFKSNAAVAAQPQNDSWKAQGFLNLYLPGLNGQRKKLGAIPLKDSKTNEKKLLAWLNEDPSRVAQILAKLEIEYQSALPADTAGFDLTA
jgi:NAD-specific glutamate dehydrogenase